MTCCLLLSSEWTFSGIAFGSGCLRLQFLRSRLPYLLHAARGEIETFPPAGTHYHKTPKASIAGPLVGVRGSPKMLGRRPCPPPCKNFKAATVYCNERRGDNLRGIFGPLPAKSPMNGKGGGGGQRLSTAGRRGKSGGQKGPERSGGADYPTRNSGSPLAKRD